MQCRMSGAMESPWMSSKEETYYYDEPQSAWELYQELMHDADVVSDEEKIMVVDDGTNIFDGAAPADVEVATIICETGQQ